MTPDEATPSAAHSPSAIPSPSGLALAPFRALRFATRSGDALARVTSPPYDVINEDERRELESADPHNVVRLILPRDQEGHPGSGYRRAGQTLSSWRAQGVLAADERAALYVYEMDDGQHRTRGLIGALALVAPEANIVLPHENTMADTVADRLALTESTRANLETIYLVYDGGGDASVVVAEQRAELALTEAVTPDGMTHRLWAISDDARLAAITRDLYPRRAVIADGHHRYATYLRHQAQCHARGAGPGPWDSGLVMLVDSTMYGPQVHAIHRVIPDLPLRDALVRARNGFTVTELPGGEHDALKHIDSVTRHEDDRDKTAFVLTDGSSWYLLTGPDATQLADTLPADRSDAWRNLDVTVAHRFLIEKLWQRRDHEDVVGFRHNVSDAIAAVARSGGTALLLRPTPVRNVIAVAAAAERMPRKSTLFTPKPRTGFVMRAYSDEPV